MRSSIIIGSILVARSIDMSTFTPFVSVTMLAILMLAFILDGYEFYMKVEG